MNTLDLFRNESNPMEFKPGDVIFSEGEAGDRMYVVQTGEVDILAGQTVVDTAVAGDIFGEMALIDTSARSATARAKTDCSLIPVDQKRFTFLIQQTPFFSIHVMRILADRIRKFNKLRAH
jgi:CRP/FNR family cyclic AMP-dependent transcriptional regulator